MKNRNQFEEMYGLYWESETHEWFNDKLNTQRLHKASVGSRGEYQSDELPNLYCFCVRDKETGEYTRVIIDKLTQSPILEAEGYMEMASKIDMIKIARRFEVSKFDVVEDFDTREILIKKWKQTGKTAEEILKENRGRITGIKFGI
jgi:hypothetical protein